MTRAFFQYMSRVEKITLGVLAALLVLSAALTVAGFIKRHTHLIPQKGGVYREAAVGQPRYLNPILAAANDADVDITRLVYSSLWRIDSQLQLQNDLAERYELSADHKEYTVHIRPGVTWHDGQPLTADDVVYTIQSIQAPDYASPLASSFSGVTVEKVDGQTVRFKLKQPYAPFLSSLTVSIAPKHVWENIPPKNVALAEQMLKPVGTGPFKFSDLTTRRKTGEITTLRLMRNENFYGPTPYLDGMTFNFFTSYEDGLKALISGQVDGLGFLPLQLVERAKARHTVVLDELKLPQYFALFFNPDKHPALRDAKVRQALSLATDRQQLLTEALAGAGEALSVPIPTGLLGHSDQPGDAFDPETAKRLLDEAGWQAIDKDGIREKDTQRLHFKLVTTDWPEYVHTAEVVQKQWRAIGVETQIEHFGPGAIQQSAVRPREYDILLFGEILAANPDPYPFWHSTQVKSPGLNFAALKNPDIDKLLEQARQSFDAADRQKKYQDFQAKFLELRPAIVLYRPYYLFATKNYVRGIDISSVDLPASRFNAIENWHVKTKRVWNN